MDLLEAIHDEIREGSYVCLVCHNDIDSHSPIWSCRKCFRSFDIACIRDWSQRDSKNSSHWRCPHCLSAQTQKPSSIRYRCWCGKIANPGKASASSSNDPWKSSISSLSGSIPPHSCGQTCGAKRECPHPCPLVCHAGPHLDSAKCMYQGPRLECFCGKKTEQRLCAETSYGGFSCGLPCGRKHSRCGHECTRTCHKAGKARHRNDSCGPCKTSISVTCFCGKMKRTKRACSSLGPKAQREIKSRWKNKTEGKISCGSPCSALLKCGHHKCDLGCHPTEASTHDCPFQPFNGETCFCGKELVHRQNCYDEKPSCGNTCDKELDCGHKCAERCHEGQCPPCQLPVLDVPCRCRRTLHTTTCYEARHQRTECNKTCGALLSCRRHTCSQKCCEFAPKGGIHASRKSHKHRTLTLAELLQDGANALNVNDEARSEAEEAAHLCIRICGKMLNCGMHTCVQPCHSGACPPCLAATFDEMSCPCGRTRLDPPIRCGTTVPRCKFPCHRAQDCGHPAQHECHPDGVPCPPCSVMVPTTCRCGKSKVPVRCSQRSNDAALLPRCMESCGAMLKCGHICQRQCCLSGDACFPCENQCNRRYENCGHTHQGPCHFPSECPKQCNHELLATCPCGVLKLPYTCGEDLEIGCNDICVRESYPLVVLDAYEDDKPWFISIENQIRAFVLQKQPARTHWFKPMNRQRRRFVYYLLDHYNLEGQSMDEGANRSICAYRTSDTWLPKIRLSQASRRRPQIEISSEDEENNKDQEKDEHTDVTIDQDDIIDTGELVAVDNEWQPTTRSNGGQVPTISDSKKHSVLSISQLTRSFSALSVE